MNDSTDVFAEESEQKVMRNVSEVFSDMDNINNMDNYAVINPNETLHSKIRVIDLLSKMWGTSRAYNTGDTELENAQLRIENYSLHEKIRSIETRLTHLESLMPVEKVVVLRDIPLEQAKKEVQELFAERGTLYYSDIASELGISLELAVKICNELQDSGAIEVDGGTK